MSAGRWFQWMTCYICRPEEHQHDDPECLGCDQGCGDCEASWDAYFAEAYADVIASEA